MYYVIGRYGDEWNILGSYPNVKEAQHSVWWQGQPRGEIEWHDANRTHATTGDSWRGKPTFTEWRICKPSHTWGMFEPLDGSDAIKVSRGCYTTTAFATICDKANREYHEEVF